MWYYVMKVGLSAVLVVLVSELSKRSTIAGGLLASLPLVSLLGIVWLWLDTRDPARVSRLSREVFWLVIPSLAFFMVLPLLLDRGLSFTLSMLAAGATTVIGYGITLGVMHLLRHA